LNSVINFIAATMGSGNISLAYVIMKNGYVGGCILILIGGLISYYTGLLLAICGSYTK
jgi:amino acid permease